MEYFWIPRLVVKLPLAFFMVVVLLLVDSTGSNAQQGYWSAQEKVPNYYDFTEEPPYLIADLNHTVHAFNAQPLDLADANSPKAIFYRQWTMENGWTTPNDILYDIFGESISLVGVVSDKFGIVHMVFQGSNQSLYYTHAYLAEADSSTAWAEPQLIAERATVFATGFEYIGAIAVDADANKLVVIYSGSQYGAGLYCVFSLDRGVTWSPPELVYFTAGDDVIVTDPELIEGESGIFHAVWSNFKSDGSAGSGYYAAWNPTINVWSKPINLDIPGIRTPSLIEYNGDIFITYYHASTNGNWWRSSSDDGLTWSTPVQVSPFHKGTNGGISFVVDSSNTLHIFFGERIDDNNHGMWHAVWTGTTWSIPDAVVRGPQVKDEIGGDGFDPRSARAVICNGNVILSTCGTDGAAGLNGAWYSYKILDTPELPSQLLLSPTTQITDKPISNTPMVASSIVENTPVLPDELKNEYPDVVQGPQASILLGIIPAILLLIGFIVLRVYFRSKNP